MNIRDLLPDPRHWTVTVHGVSPALDCIDRLHAIGSPPHCASCLKPLDPDACIYVNTEGATDRNEANTDFLCSWACLLLLAASVVETEDGFLPPAISVAGATSPDACGSVLPQTTGDAP